MDVTGLITAIDAAPFRPFEIELSSGTRIPVRHPENIFLLPSRQKVLRVEVYHPESGSFTLIFPEGLAAVYWNGDED